MALTRDEVKLLFAQMDGVPLLVCQLLFGGGLRLLECLILRVKDIDVWTTMIYTHVLNRGGRGVVSPGDLL